MQIQIQTLNNTLNSIKKAMYVTLYKHLNRYSAGTQRPQAH